MSSSRDDVQNGAQVYGGCNCGQNKSDGSCCNDHTVLPIAGPPNPQQYCNKAHGSTFESGQGACKRIWTKINNTCTAADYFENFQCKYIGIRRPKTEPVTVIPRNTITPVVMTDVRVDTTKTHSAAGGGIVLPCKGVWDIVARAWFKNPLEMTNDPPAENGVLSPTARLSIFIGRNGGFSYAREYSPAQFVEPLWIPVHVDRTECLDKGDTFTLSAYWEDPGSDELQELEIASSSITAQFVCHCDGSVV